MRTLSWASSFRRAFRRYVRRHPFLHEQIFETLRRLSEDPFGPGLDTHKLKGDLKGLWACSAAYDCRIVFDFVKRATDQEDIILLIDIGTHDEVY